MAIANMRKGVAEGWFSLGSSSSARCRKYKHDRRRSEVESVLSTDRAHARPLLGEADRVRLTRAYTEAIEQRIVPSYRRLLAYLKDDYLAKTRSTIALSDLPGGNAWYDHLVKTQTTTDLAPDQIFQLGQDEIARIKMEMERLRERQRLCRSLAEFPVI